MFWSKEHLYTLIPTMIVEFILAIIIGHFLKDKDEKVKMIPIKVIAIVLLVLELAKQIYSFVDGYDLYRLPFHFCSLFLYFIPVAVFYNGKYKNIFKLLSIVISACLFMFLCIYPNVIYSGESIKRSIDFITFKGGSFIDFHSWIFHSIAVFLFFLFLFLDVYKFDIKKDIKIILIAFAIYCVIVGPFSQIVKTNYNNFYHSNAPFIEDVRVKLISSLDWGGQVIYVLMVSVGTLIVPILSYFIFRGLSALKNKIVAKND